MIKEFDPCISVDLRLCNTKMNYEYSAHIYSVCEIYNVDK